MGLGGKGQRQKFFVCLFVLQLVLICEALIGHQLIVHRVGGTVGDSD